MPSPTLVAGLGEPRGDDDDAVHALARAVEYDLRHRLGGYGDDREVDVAGDLLDRPVSGEPGDRLGLRVDGVHRTGEIGQHEVADQHLADGVLAATRPDDGDAARTHEPLNGRGLCTVLARLHHADRRVGGVDGEDETHHAVFDRALDLVPLLAEHLDHPGVLGQDLGDELLVLAFAARLREVLEQQLTQPAPLMRVLDQERDLGLTVVDRVIAPDGDDLLRDRDDEGDPALVVHMGEPLDVAIRQGRVRREEAVVLGLVGHPRVEVDEPLRVICRDRAELGGTTVA